MAKKAPTQEPCLWERQPDESEAAWEAFLVYRDMEVPRRFQAVADKLQKSYSLIRRWKTAWFWEDRVIAYDNEIQKEALASAVNDRRKMNQRHTELAMRLLQAATDALDKLNTDDLSFKDIREAVKLGAELERRARDESIGEYRGSIAESDAEDKEDVVIYLPSNGRDVNDERK